MEPNWKIHFIYSTYQSAIEFRSNHDVENTKGSYLTTLDILISILSRFQTPNVGTINSHASKTYLDFFIKVLDELHECGGNVTSWNEVFKIILELDDLLYPIKSKLLIQFARKFEEIARKRGEKSNRTQHQMSLFIHWYLINTQTTNYYSYFRSCSANIWKNNQTFVNRRHCWRGKGWNQWFERNQLTPINHFCSS